MAGHENEEIVRETYAAYLRADLEAVLESCSEDTEWLAFGPADRLPYAGSHRGREQVARVTLQYSTTKKRAITWRRRNSSRPEIK